MVGLSLHQEQAELPGGIAFLKRKNRHGTRRVVSTGPPACGWLRGTSRTSPGPPRRWRGPVRLQGTSARGRGFAAYLSACGGQPLQRPRCGLRQGGASLTTFGFVTTVPRYLPVASNSLTCVRGADRAYCAPRKWLWRPTFALQKLAAARPPEGHWRAHPAAAPCRRTRQRHLAAAPGSGTLPLLLRKKVCPPVQDL